MKLNTVYLAENLEFMRKLDSEIIDLIYIDPPFYSGVEGLVKYIAFLRKLVVFTYIAMLMQFSI